MRGFHFKAASCAGAPRWEEMKGRTRCKEANIFAVQNCKWIDGHGEPVRTSTAICMWATRKRAFSLSWDIFAVDRSSIVWYWTFFYNKSENLFSLIKKSNKNEAELHKFWW